MTNTTTERRLLAPSFDLNDRLGKGREAAGVTQTRMAEMIGCSVRTVSRYENAGVKVPRWVVLAYHVVCNLDMAWLQSGIPSWEGGESTWYDPSGTEKAPRQSEGPIARPEGLEPPTFCSVADDVDRYLAFLAIVGPLQVSA